MKAARVELKEANEFIGSLHRHHKPVQGHRFSVGAEHQGKLVGVATVGRPVARNTDQKYVAEVTRLCTDGTSNACSFLYATCARIAKEMGFKKIQTFILDSEPGCTLEASGWTFESISAGGDWTSKSKPNRRQDQPQCPKRKYSKELNA